MALSLDLDIIAEGVETKEQLEFLCARNCHEIQGYFFSRPLPPEHLIQWIKQDWSNYRQETLVEAGN